MRQFFLALQFLTIIPIKPKVVQTDELAKSSLYFPCVGAIIGILLLVFYKIFLHFLPLQIVCVGLIGLWILLTAGLHIDGLMDTLDGIGGGSTQEEVVKIMHDEKIGVFGICGFFVVFMTKFTALCEINASIVGAIILSPTIGRWTIVINSFLFSYIDSHQGLAKPFVEETTKKEVFLSSLFTLAATIFFGIYAVILMLLVCLTILIINRTIITKKAGGINGDILGFGVEISEALVLLGALLLERYGILLVCNF